MKKSFFKAFVPGLLMSLSGVFANAGEPQPRAIYFTGVEWYEPCVDNLDYYDNHKLLETAPGSNVYVGTEYLQFTPAWIGFFTELGLEHNLDNYVTHRLTPVDRYLGDPTMYQNPEYLRPLGRSGFHTGSLAQYEFMPNNMDGTWVLNEGPGYYTFIVDLENNLFLVSYSYTDSYKRGCLIVPEGAPVPTFDTIENYIGIENEQYIPAGDYSFRIYDILNDKWLEPRNGEISYTAERQGIDFTVTESSAMPFVLKDWQGGILNVSYANDSALTVKIYPDKFNIENHPDYSTTTLYQPGGYGNWDFYSCYQYTSDVPSTSFEINVPDSEWKLSLDTGWRLNFGVMNVIAEEDGSFTAYLERDGNNFDTTGTPEGVKAQLDLEKMTVKFPAGTNITPFGRYPDGSYPEDIDEMYFLTRDNYIVPFKGASEAVMNMVRQLHKNDDGSYEKSLGLYGDFVIVKELKPYGEHPVVIAPAEGIDRPVNMPEGHGLSSYVETTLDKAGYWTVDDYREFYTNIKVTDSAVEFSSNSIPSNDCIYMVGSPQGWNIYNDDLRLYPTTDGGFYGSFDIYGPTTDVMFRFYTALGDWENNSIGWCFEDMLGEYVTFNEDGLYTGGCCFGKGPWAISEWPGGTLYVYVNLEDYRVEFSTVPLNHELVDTSIERPRMFVYSETSNGLTELKLQSDGTFFGKMSGAKDGVARFALLSELSLYTPDDPKWNDGEFIVPAADGIVKVDRQGVAEASYKKAVGYTPFEVNLDSPVFNYYVTVDPSANKVYVENGEYMFITGEFTDVKELTFENRSELSAYQYDSNATISIPADKFDFEVRRAIGDKSKLYVANIEFDEAGAYQGYSDFGIRYVKENWSGGSIMIDLKGHIINLAEIKALAMVVNNEVVTMERVAGTNSFIGKADFVRNEYGAPSLYFLINRYSNSESYYYGYPLGFANSEKLVTDETGVVSGKLTYYYDSNNVGCFPTFFGEGEAEVTVDLSDLIATVKLPVDNLRPAYELVADEESPLDGTIAYPSESNEDAVVVAASANEDVEFNFTKPDGTVLVPDGDGDIEFDACGLWTGSFKALGSPSGSRIAARRAAAGEAKWNLRLSDCMPTNLFILIDEGSNAIKVFSSAHNSDVIFIKNKVRPTIENIDEILATAMRKNAEGHYVGSFEVVENEENYVSFINTLTDLSGALPAVGLYCPFEANAARTFDCTESESQTRGAVFSTWSSPWVVIGSGTLYADYNPEANELTVTGKAMDGIENVAADNVHCISIVPVAGGLRFYAPFDFHADVYMINGFRAKSLDLPAGVTVVDLPAGFYIVNGKKYFVR